MRRIVTMVCAGAALLLGGCGSDGGNGTNGSAAVEAAASAKGVEAACVTQSAQAAFQAGGANAANVDFTKVSAQLEAAAKAAPTEIRADFRLVATALEPYWEMVAKYKGDFQKLAADPEFAAAAESFSSPELTAAGERIQAWYAEHCQP